MDYLTWQNYFAVAIIFFLAIALVVLPTQENLKNTGSTSKFELFLGIIAVSLTWPITVILMIRVFVKGSK